MKPKPRFVIIDLRHPAPEPRRSFARIILEPEPDALTTPDSARALRPAPPLGFDPHGLSLTDTSRHIEHHLMPTLEGMRCPTCATPAPIRPRPCRVQPKLTVVELAVLEADRKRLVCVITCPACRVRHDYRFEWSLPFTPARPELDIERLTEILADLRHKLRQYLVTNAWYEPPDNAMTGMHVSPAEYHTLASDPGIRSLARTYETRLGRLTILDIPIIADPDLHSNRSLRDLDNYLVRLRAER